MPGREAQPPWVMVCSTTPAARRQVKQLDRVSSSQRTPSLAGFAGEGEGGPEEGMRRRIVLAAFGGWVRPTRLRFGLRKSKHDAMAEAAAKGSSNGTIWLNVIVEQRQPLKAVEVARRDKRSRSAVGDTAGGEVQLPQPGDM